MNVERPGPRGRRAQVRSNQSCWTILSLQTRRGVRCYASERAAKGTMGVMAPVEPRSRDGRSTILNSIAPELGSRV